MRAGLQRLQLILVVLGYSMLLPGCHRSDGADADQTPETAADPVSVDVVDATVTTLRPSIDLVGTIVSLPERSYDIAARIEGLITRVAVVEGQSVHTGDTLVTLDERILQARLETARAAVQKAQATLTKLEHGPRPQEIEAAHQKSLQLDAVARSLQSKVDAMRVLHDKGDVSDVRFGQAQAERDAAVAEAGAADAQWRLLKAGTRPEQISEARADLAAARATLMAADLAVRFCTITSPIDGVVMQLSARAGAFVTPADVLATVVDTSEMFARVRIPTTYLTQVSPVQRADVRPVSDPDRVLDGVIARLGPRAGAGSGDVDAFIAITATDTPLPPGLACRVRIWLPQLPDALVVPVQAVADLNGTPVVTVIRDMKAYEQPIRIGVTTPQRVQVVEGLSAGDTVATRGGYGLPDGCPVRVEKSPPGEN